MTSLAPLVADGVETVLVVVVALEVVVVVPPLEPVLELPSLPVLLPLPPSLESVVSSARTDWISDQGSAVVGSVSPGSMWKPAAVYDALAVVVVVVVVVDESLSSSLSSSSSLSLSSSSSSSGSELLLPTPELPMSPGGQNGQPESHHELPNQKGLD